MKLEIKDGKVFKNGVELVEKESTDRPYKDKRIYCVIDDEKKHAFYGKFMRDNHYESNDFEMGYRHMISDYLSSDAVAYLSAPNNRTKVTEEEFVYEMSQRDPEIGWTLYKEEPKPVFYGGDSSPLSEPKTYQLPDWVGFNQHTELLWEQSVVFFDDEFNQYDKSSKDKKYLIKAPHHLIECEYKDVKAGEFFVYGEHTDSIMLNGLNMHWEFTRFGSSHKIESGIISSTKVLKVVKS